MKNYGESEQRVAPRGASDAEVAPARDLFAKCDSPRIDEAHLADAVGLFPYFVEMASEAGPEVVSGGRRLVTLGSNNYLGLTQDPRVKRAAIDAVERFGTGCTGSRLMNGTLSLHRELEEAILDWIPGEGCLVFTTGYAVNLGLTSALVEADDRIFLDAHSHASLFDGTEMSRGSMRLVRHNSPATLRRRLEAWREQGGAGALVAVDGVFSMEGDVAPLAEIAEVCARLDARLLVDEAHGLGVIGPEGAGAAAAAGVRPDLVMGTFSKSLASCGGFVVGPGKVIEYLKLVARPFLFTASGVPAALGAALEALRIARAEDWRREALIARAARLRAGLRDLGYDTGPAAGTAIIPVHVGDDWSAVRVWKELMDRGVYTNCAVAPAVPAGRALLRNSVIATHTEEHIDRALAAFEAARSKLA
jgi:8-amino-7-oxononanoate synthase